jgi:cytochrome c-type biogenesis protein CcmF
VAKGILLPEKRQYVTSDQLMTEVGIRSTVREDLYLILSAMDDVDGALSANSAAQGIDLQVLVKPFVAWIWYGGLILALGTVIALWPSVDRRRRSTRPELEAVTTDAPAMAGAAR